MPAALNHPFLVWGTNFLWLISIIAITWSLILFFCLGDMLMITETDIINSFVLLLGILMLPINVLMLCYISSGRKIRYDTRVLCCPLWLGKVWVIIVSVIGAILCVLRLRSSGRSVNWAVGTSLQNYRTIPKFKRFIDNLQWSLQCCGLDSYEDWFDHDWFDKSRDYEWEPPTKKRSGISFSQTDSVPLSCCKSGSCISNYLIELGTRSINTRGCKDITCKILQLHMAIHLVLLLLVILTELVILKYLMQESVADNCSSICTAAATHNYNFVQRIMSVNEKFDASSDSYRRDDDSDTLGEQVLSAQPKFESLK